MPDVTPEALADYLTAREEQREREIAAALPDLERAMAVFVEAHAGDPSLGRFLARLVRETAVAAYVRGGLRMGAPPPGDSVMFHAALETARSNEDLYPAWRVFDGRHLEEGDG